MTVKLAKLVAEYFIGKAQTTLHKDCEPGCSEEHYYEARMLNRINSLMYFTYAWEATVSEEEIFPLYTTLNWVNAGENVDQHIRKVFNSNTPVEVSKVVEALEAVNFSVLEACEEVWEEYGEFSNMMLFSIINNDKPLWYARRNDNKVDFSIVKETYLEYNSYSVEEK